MELVGDLTRELPYWAIRDGAVVLRDGSYRLGFDVRLPGTEVWDAAQLAACNERLRILIGTAVPEGECLRMLLEIHPDYTDLLRAYADVCRCPPPAVPAEDQAFEIPRRVLNAWPFFGRGSVRTAVARSDLYRRWDFLWLDGHAHAVVAMDTLPDRPTTPNMLGPLQTLPGAYWLIIEAWNDPRSDQIKRLELKSRLSRQAVLAQDGGDSNARAVDRQVADALDVLQRTSERVMRVGVAVVLQESSGESVQDADRRALDALHQIPGVDARIESVALRRQFVQLAPFSGMPNERLMRMLTSNAADFVPCHAL